MVDLKPMPEREKFLHAFEMVSMYQKNVLPFVEHHLGFGEMHNLRSIWQAAIGPIREADSDQDKYVQAYSNWLWIAHCSHNTLADELSRDDVLEYKRLLLRIYKRQKNTSRLFILRMLRMHTFLSKVLLYEMQWMTPVELTNCSRSQVTCVVPHCKVLQTSGTERICRVDCQNIGSVYARQLYNLKRVTELNNHGCTMTLTPVEK